MKYLIDRKEIATAMNFGKYPVLHIDLDHKPSGQIYQESDFATGDDVKVAWDLPNRYEGMTTRGKVYHENGKFYIDQNCSVLKNSFGVSDILEDLHWANAPTVHKGQTVVLVIERTKQNGCAVVLMKVSDKIDIHCSTVCRLEEINEE